MGASGGREVPQALHGDGHHTYRCYLRGPDGVHELPTRGPGARSKATRIREPASTGAPRIRYVFYFDLLSHDSHPDRVESIGGAGPAVLMDPPPCRRHDRPPLGSSDGFQRSAPGRGRARLHLHEGDDPTSANTRSIPSTRRGSSGPAPSSRETADALQRSPRPCAREPTRFFRSSVSWPTRWRGPAGVGMAGWDASETGACVTIAESTTTTPAAARNGPVPVPAGVRGILRTPLSPVAAPGNDRSPLRSDHTGGSDGRTARGTGSAHRRTAPRAGSDAPR